MFSSGLDPWSCDAFFKIKNLLFNDDIMATQVYLDNITNYCLLILFKILFCLNDDASVQTRQV